MLKESESHFRFMVTFLKNKGDKKADSVNVYWEEKREILPVRSLWVLGSRRKILEILESSQCALKNCLDFYSTLS